MHRSQLVILILMGVLVMGMGAPAKEENLLKNGDFEGSVINGLPEYWGKEPYNCEVVSGFEGGKALNITNEKPAFSLGAQELPLDGTRIRRLTLSAYVKGEDIKVGAELWQKGNLQLLFFDKDGKQIGGWPEIGPWEGTFDWQKVKKDFQVPRAAKKAKVVLGLLNATGTIYFDEVYLYPSTEKSYNLVSNGDFEVFEDWIYGGEPGTGMLLQPGYKSQFAFRVKNDKPAWSFILQSIELDGQKVRKIKVEAMVKVEKVVQGEKPWQKARINLEFKDASGNRIGAWPVVGEWLGSSDWQKVSKGFSVPAKTKRVEIFCGILETTGVAWFDNIAMYGFTEDGKLIPQPGEFITATSGWYEFKPGKDEFEPTIIDVSFLLDPPAGKHGFLKVEGGHFYFEDGTRARFWGTNIYGPNCFVSHEEAERVAKRLAKFGCNLVRLHHLDAFWSKPNIFDPKYDDTQHLSKDSLEKLDYLIYQLKKHGIYIFMDLLVDREFKKGDNLPDWKNVERGAKFSGLFNKRIIDLQKKYAKDLLTHRNPYTGLRYIDDPAIVSAKLINEAMLYYIAQAPGLSKVYLKELDQKWNQWLLKKYKSRAGIKKAWGTELKSDEDPVKGTVKRGRTALKMYRGADMGDLKREADTMAFYYDLQVNYFKEMEKYLRSIGCKVPISGSNHWINVAADVRSNAVLDYIDRHRYWDHPQFGYGAEAVFDDQPMVNFPFKGLPAHFASYKIAGKPFVVSEWNNCWPNEYRTEGVLLMAAYACLQDWDGVLQFSFAGGNWTNLMNDSFDIGSQPIVFCQWPAAALLFHRQDVKTAETVIEEILGGKDIFGLIEEDKLIEGDYPPLTARVQRKFGKESKVPDLSLISDFYNKEKGEFTSETEELKWNAKDGFFTINTEKTQAAVGFLGGKTIELNNLFLKLETEFCSIVLSKVEKNHYFLTATARAENSEQVWNESKTQLKSIGHSPILIEGVKGKVSLKLSETPKVYALDVNGQRLEEIRVDSSGEFEIKGALFYEIIL